MCSEIGIYFGKERNTEEKEQSKSRKENEKENEERVKETQLSGNKMQES